MFLQPPLGVTLLAALQPEAKRWRDACTVRPTTLRLKQVDLLIRSLQNVGVWAKLDVFYLLAAHDAQAARLNLVNPSTFGLAEISGPTFTVDRGYAGDGAASYLRSTYQPGVSSGIATQNDNHLGAWCNTNTTVGAAEFGSGGHFLSAKNSSNNLVTRNMAGTSDSVTVASPVGYMLAARNNASTYNRYFNGVALADATRASTMPGSFGMAVCARATSAATADLFSARQISFAHSGSFLTAAQVYAIYSISLTYLQAVGAA